MTHNREKNASQTGKNTARPAPLGSSQVSPPLKRRKFTLTKVSHIRAELGRLYGEARRGEVDVQDASRLANLLGILHRVIASSDLEERLEAVEQRLKKEETPK